MKQEIERRQSNTEKVLELFRANPMVWLDAGLFMKIAGSMAWRTRISDARKIIEAEGGLIENQQQRIQTYNEATGHLTQVEQVLSSYRYVPYIPLGPSAETPRSQKSLF